MSPLRAAALVLTLFAMPVLTADGRVRASRHPHGEVVVMRVGTHRHRVTPGTRFRVWSVTRAAARGRVLTTYYASPRRRVTNASVRIARRRVLTRGDGHPTRRSAAARLPAGFGRVRLWLVACARPAGHRARQRNCHASGQRLKVAGGEAVTEATSPSGVPMPRGDLPGWHQVFSDDFTGAAIDASKWGLYSGQPAGDPGGWWAPSHVRVRNGLLTLRTYRDAAFNDRWVSGGMSSGRALRQTYGRYDVRFRMDKGHGVACVLLLMPAADHWPPEIDFAENGGAGPRDRMTASLHYGTDNRQIQRTVYADFTRWHTMGVRWRPGRLVLTLDGTVWAVIADWHVPSQPMELDAQTQAGTQGDPWTPAPDATTPPEVDMHIDWVTAYAPAR